MKMKVVVSFVLLVAFVAAGAAIKAQAANVIKGWLWGGSEDANIGGTGSFDGNETGAGWISMNSSDTGSGVSYAVNIPNGDGGLSGYAWSENLGWISFNASDVTDCAAGSTAPRRVGNSLAGFARIMGIKQEMASGNNGGWTGCISLNGSDYGVTIDTSSTPNKFSGYGWNGETAGSGSNMADGIGWIDFSRATTECVSASAATYSCSISNACGSGECGQKTRSSICAKKDDCGTSIVDQDECESHHVDCPDPEVVDCGICNSDQWQER